MPAPLAVGEAQTDDETAILVRRHGNPAGPRIVLSHANGFAVDAYYPFWSLLMDRFDVVVFDLRNHGWNPVGALETHAIATFVRDMAAVAQAIEAHFGPKPAVGVFHSLSGQAAAIEACSGPGSFAALALFDPFICPRGCHPGHRERLRTTMGRMVEGARHRRGSFASEAAFAQRLRNTPAFQLLRPGVAELLAQTTLRGVNGGSEFVLRCPREYEARIYEQGYQHASTVDVDAISCPSSDRERPRGAALVPANRGDGRDRRVELRLRARHNALPQLEEPERCLAALLDFIGEDGDRVLAEASYRNGTQRKEPGGLWSSASSQTSGGT